MKQIRQRYILFEILTPQNQPIDQDTISKAIWKSLLDFFGEQQTFHAGLWIIRYDPQARIGILRCDHILKLQVITAMTFLREINHIPILIHTWKTSGTIKKTLQLWRKYFPTVLPPPRDENSKK
jgi:RNase P/RNase MRP subunit POP5